MEATNESDLELRATAFHEAGHAIASLVKEKPFKEVHVVPGGDYLGAVVGMEMPNWALETLEYGSPQDRWAKLPMLDGNQGVDWNQVLAWDAEEPEEEDVDWKARVVAWVQDTIIIKMAGRVAEEIFRGDDSFSHDTWEQDRETAADLASGCCGSNDELSAMLNEGFQAAKTLLAVPQAWRAVETLAEALLEHKTMTSDQATALLAAAGLPVKPERFGEVVRPDGGM